MYSNAFSQQMGILRVHHINVSSKNQNVFSALISVRQHFSFQFYLCPRLKTSFITMINRIKRLYAILRIFGNVFSILQTCPYIKCLNVNDIIIDKDILAFSFLKNVSLVLWISFHSRPH